MFDKFDFHRHVMTESANIENSRTYHWKIIRNKYYIIKIKLTKYI